MANLFAVCSPGLEPFTAWELREMGLPVSRSESSTGNVPPDEELSDEVGGVEFRGGLQDVYRANLHLRTASRVLFRLGGFYADSFSDLRRRAKRLPWETCLRPGREITLRVTCQKSRLYHSEAVAEKLVEAIADRVKVIPPVQKPGAGAEEGPPQLIVVRLVENRCTIHIDSSGALLHRRGYRLAAGKAPLRETLAAGILLASGWQANFPLLDPFCGSGTIAIEAALMARKIAPGQGRQFAFMNWPNFDAGAWQKLRAESLRSRGGVTPPLTPVPKIFASDRDAGAVQAARANAGRAGVADCIDFSCRAISAVEPPKSPGWVVTNPPYGLRLSPTKDLRHLYAQFGRVLRVKCSGWQVALLSSSAQLLRSTGLEFDRGIPLRNGGIKVRLVKGKI